MSRESKIMNQIFRRGSGIFGLIKTNSIFLGVPALSSGATLSDKSGFGNHGIIEGVHTQTRYNNLGAERGMFEGNGEDYISVPTAVGLDTAEFTVLIDVVLPKFSVEGFLFTAIVNGSNYVYVNHVSSNTVRLHHFLAGVGVSVDITTAVENERVQILAVIDATDLSLFQFHSSGAESNTGTISGSFSSPFTEIVVAGAGSITTKPISEGTSIGLVALYNEAKDEQFGQDVYDQLMGRTLGADLVDAGAGTFDSGTYSWVAQGINTVANVGNALEVTFVDDATGALQILNSTSGDLDSNMISGNVYVLQFTASINTGVADMQANFATFNLTRALTTTPTIYSWIFTYDGTVSPLFRFGNLSGVEIGVLDNWSLKRVTNTGVLSSDLLNTLSPTGATITPATWTARATDITTKELGTPDLDITLVSNAIPTGGSTSIFLRESANVTEKLELRMVITSGNLEIYEYDPTATLLGTVTAIETGSMRIAVRDKQIDIYRNGGATSVFSNTLQDETEYGTQMSVVIAGTHTIDLKFEDTFNKAIANDIELMQHLDADAYYRLGQLAEQLGYDEQDLVATSEMFVLNGKLNFPSQSNSYMTLPYNPRINADTYLRLFLINAYSTGGNTQGRIYDQGVSQLRIASSLGVSMLDDYVTVNAEAKTTGGMFDLGQNGVIGVSLNETNDRGTLWSDGGSIVPTTDTTGTGGRDTETSDFSIGSASPSTKYYGTMSKFAFLHQLATEALMRWLQVHLRIRQYYQDSENILQPTVNLIPRADGTFHNTVDNTQVAGTNLALGTTVDDIGAYPIDFDGTAYVDLLSAGLITGEIPTDFIIIVRVNLDNWASGAIEYLWTLRGNSIDSQLSLFKLASNFLRLLHFTTSGTDTLDIDVSGLTGEHELVVTVNLLTGESIEYLDGVKRGELNPSVPIAGAFTRFNVGVNATTPSDPLNGTISQFSYKPEAISAIDIMRHRNLISANGSESMKYALDNHSPIVLLPMNEVSGSAIYNLADPDEEFTATNITTYEAERFPNGALAMEFGGANSVIFNPSISINGNDGTFIGFFEFDNPSDNSLRYMFRVGGNGSNDIYLRKNTDNNIVASYLGSGVQKTTTVVAPSGKFQIVFTWSPNEITLTINNDMAVSTPNSTSWDFVGNEVVYFGASTSIGGSSFDGLIGDALLDIVAWTEAEILAYYEANVGRLL